MSDPRYLVWSNEHGRWWGPEPCGFDKMTRLIEAAGRYTLNQAEKICFYSNVHLPPEAMRHEVLVLAPESLPKEPPHA